MKKSKTEGKIFRTMKEIEKEFLPEVYKSEMRNGPPDEYELGAKMAQRTMAKLRDELSEAVGSI